MSFRNFENVFLSNLKIKSKDCFNDILSNEKIIKEYLNDNNYKILNAFVNNFNDVLISNNKDFDFYEKILSEKIFYDVLKEFRNSTILIRACKAKNINLLKWLLTMNINTCNQNEYGVSALMVACKDPDLLFVVKYLLSHDKDNMNLCDNNGETALFYALYNKDALRLLLDSNINANCLNKNNDTVVTYCCRNKIYEPLKTLSVKNNVDTNIFDNYEKTALMYLMEDCRSSELRYFINDNINFYFKNQKNETAMSIFFKNYYDYYKQLNIEKIIQCIKVIQVLVDKNVNLNISIDEEGNTPMMFFIMIEDWVSMAYLIMKCKNLDLSIKNNKGESASSLCEKHKPTKESVYSGLNTKYLMYHIFSHPTFDASYRGNAGINILMNYIINYVQNYELNFIDLLKARKEFKTVTNDDQENLLIVAIKLGRRDIIKYIVSAEGGDINHQDILGNTALHYAVMLNDCYIADLLAYNHADINIKNKDGLSPVNLARNSGNSSMVKFLLKPCPSYKVQKMEKKGNSIFSFGKGNDLGEINENLIKKYQEKYNDDIKIHEKKIDDIYVPNVTPKFNTEYFKDVFKTYFPNVMEAYSFDPLRNSPLDLERLSERQGLPPLLFNMLANKDTLAVKSYINNIDFYFGIMS